MAFPLKTAVNHGYRASLSCRRHRFECSTFVRFGMCRAYQNWMWLVCWNVVNGRD